MTGVGKSSLVRTLKDYIDHPSERPQSILSGVHSELLETQVMELYESKIDPEETAFSIDLDPSSKRPTLINFKANSEDSKTPSSGEKSLKIKVVDMGGHHEYYSSATLFVAGNGLFLVCFDSSTIQNVISEPEYYAKVGSYLDLVSQVAARIGIQPRLALVATKVEGPRNLKEAFNQLLQMTKDHLKSLEIDSFLVEEVFQTSSLHATRENLEEICQKVFALCSDVLLANKPLELMPDSWFELLEVMMTESVMTLERIEELFKNIKMKQTEPQHKMDNLKKFQTTLEFIAQNEDDMNQEEPRQGDSETIPEGDFTEGDFTEGDFTEGDSTKGHFTVTEMDDNDWISHGCCSLPFPRFSDLNFFSRSRSGEENFTTSLTEVNQVGESSVKTIDLELKVALSYFMAQGEILWFKDNIHLRETVLTQPMDFVKALRTVISHKFVQNFGGVQLLESKRELLHKGLLYLKDFQSIIKAEDQPFSQNEIWHFLIQLNLASDLDDCLFIPCLITDSMEEKVKVKEQKLSKCREAITVQYMFDHNSQSIGKYHQVISLFSKHFVWGEKGGEICFAFSQKIEQRRLGIVGGVQGVLTWLNEGVQDPDEIEFQILEYETSFKDPEEEASNSKCHPVHRAIRISLKPADDMTSKAPFEIVKKFDEMISNDLGAVHRSLVCKECQICEEEGDFQLLEGIELKSPRKPCSNIKHDHKLPRDMIRLMEQANPRKPFELASLMSKPKQALGLQAFKDSDIKKQITEGRLKTGEQIWIYHDSSTNPWNPVARCNPYSHVVVYVGHREGKEGDKVHEIVHVKKANMRGIVMGKIVRENILDVIKPEDQIFIGHKLKSCQFAGNLREMIAKRAIACSDQPTIVFDYDHR